VTSRLQPTTSTAKPAHQERNPLRLYVQVVAAVGALVIVESIVSLRTTTHPFEWLLFVALAVLTGSFSMKIASISASLTVSDTFFITTALLFGPAPATLAVALDTFVVTWRRHHPPLRQVLNVVAPALGMWTGSHVFFWLAGIAPLAQAHAPVGQLVFPLFALAAVYFLLNSGLIAVAIGLETRKSAVQIWRQHFSWLSVHCLAAASVSFCLVLLIYQVSLSAVLVVLPMLVVLHLTLQSSFGRLEDARTHLAHLDRLYLSTVETLAMAIDAKDDVTHSHVRRVQAYALGLARALGLEEEQTLKAIEAAALLHDTGKLAVPEHILNKPGKLSPAEFEKMKRHVDVGADILSLVDFPYPVVPIVRCHHESWDGTGYPRGVAGTDIPIGARILSVVDCFDALTSDRPYRSAFTVEQAFDILRARRGNMYEPHVVDTFIRVHADIASEVIADSSVHREVLQQISQGNTATAPPFQPTAGSVPPAASDDLHVFVRLARLASGDVGVPDVLSLASALVTGVADDVTIAWYLVDERTQRLVLADGAGPAAQQLRGMTIGIGHGLSGWVAAQRQVIINSEAALDLGDRARMVMPPLESCLSVPLVSGDAVVGALTLYSPLRGGFTEQQSQMLQMIAPHIAHAIHVARRKEQRFDLPAAAPVRAPVAATHELRLVANR
jgi:putative nucleotidyltransferase with HDIG domain